MYVVSLMLVSLDIHLLNPVFLFSLTIYHPFNLLLIFCLQHIIVFLIRALNRQCQKLARFFETRDDYKCFDVDVPGGLVVILQDLMSYEDELRICSANLLYAIYKVE